MAMFPGEVGKLQVGQMNSRSRQIRTWVLLKQMIGWDKIYSTKRLTRESITIIIT